MSTAPSSAAPPSAAAAVATAMRAIVARMADLPLYEAAGAVQTLRTGYVAPLVNYTREDLEAKGLRKLEQPGAVQPPVYFSALEIAAREPLLFLRGPRGAGKSTFLQHLALHLAGAALGHPDFNLAALALPVARNDGGPVVQQAWDAGAALSVPLPVYVVADDAAALDAGLAQANALLAQAPGMPVLLMIDAAERLGADGAALLDAALRRAAAEPRLRLLVAGSADVCDDWVLPGALRKHALLPLLATQRAELRARFPGAGQLEDGDPAVLANLGLFTLSLALPPVPCAAFELVQRRVSDADADANAALARQPFVQVYLAAQALAALPAAVVAARVQAAPGTWRAPVRILARARPSAALVGALVDALLDRGDMQCAVLAAELAAGSADTEGPPDRQARLAQALLPIVERGALPVAQRAQAGRLLAALGDPRDLEALVDVAAGTFTMGATTHPNSAPPHRLTLAAYRIGKYPVTNRLYLAFALATGTPWRSTEGRLPQRANAPAVDLTWHDARACCAWLTRQWRASGKIAPTQTVRLPTEPEWEYAARGGAPDGGDAIVYPWPGGWQADRANAEDTGFNDTCTVGLFPQGASHWGCLDMAGQVWEWTTTLWGTDMATPSFAYPYAADGREDPDAAASIRRVLRGGCFSSVKEKACCTYRGSLEPNGFWRGNGFRVVVD